MASVALNLSEAFPTSDSGNWFLPPGQTWPWSLMTVKRTSVPSGEERGRESFSEKTPDLACSVCAGQGQLI
jgi:hypothetical protein